MQKEELLHLLQDPDICREIFLIMKNGGKPSVHPQTKTSASGTDRLAAIKNKLKQSTAEHNGSTSPNDKLAAIRQMMQQKAEKKPELPTLSIEEALSTVDKLSKELVEGKSSEPPKPEPDTDADNGADPSMDDFDSKLAFLRSHVQKTVEERKEQARAAEEKQAGASSAEKYTFVLERACPVCGMNTHVVKCKSRLIVESTDLDLCIHYKDINPYLYRIWACEHCGYAADEHKFTKYMPEKTQDKLMEFLQTANLAMPFTEERSSEQAIAYLEMAILFNELTDPSPNRRANLYLIMAWIYRYDGNKEKEMAALEKAAELFDLSLETESYPVDKMSDTMATYLTGAIYVLRQDYDKATRHLSRIISNQSLRTSAPKIYDMARDMWQDIKKAKGS